MLEVSVFEGVEEEPPAVITGLAGRSEAAVSVPSGAAEGGMLPEAVGSEPERPRSGGTRRGANMTT